MNKHTIESQINSAIKKADSNYTVIILIVFAIFFAFFSLTAFCGCRTTPVYIPGDDESANEQVVYFIKRGQVSTIDGIVMSKAKFYRFAKKAMLEVKESEIVIIEPIEGE